MKLLNNASNPWPPLPQQLTASIASQNTDQGTSKEALTTGDTRQNRATQISPTAETAVGSMLKGNAQPSEKKCSYCQKLNHWAKVCLTKEKDFRSKAIHTVDKEDDDDDTPIFIDAITNGNDSPDTAYANIAVSTGDTLRFKLDTGA